MKFESKMSGVAVSDYNIIPIFDSTIVELGEIKEKVKKVETVRYLFNNFTLEILSDGWYFYISPDENMKISIMEGYPEYEEELVKRIGDNWKDYYLRFGH